MTISSSLNMWVLASTRSRAAACLARSSLTRAMRSSRVKEDRFVLRDGSATASKISSSSSASAVGVTRPPFNVLSASVGLPSTAVVPPRLGVGEIGVSVLEGREKRSETDCLSKLLTREDLPVSHSCSRVRISVPMESYCETRAVSNSLVSARSRLAFGSSRIMCIFACKARMP